MAETPKKKEINFTISENNQGEFDRLIESVYNWAEERNLLSKDNVKSQMLKVVEEIGETARAVNKGDMLETVDGIGDSFVTLIILSFQLGLTPSFCLKEAYNVIASRTGKTVNGTFIKD
jgi:NTP pyrophosphatase (non-canonical NTP hydrolase)